MRGEGGERIGERERKEEEGEKRERASEGESKREKERGREGGSWGRERDKSGAVVWREEGERER